MIGADAIIKCLEAEGVSTVFGYPGVAICPFFNSILDSDIKTVLIRTEQNAAHAASGVARMTGRPGVCAVTSGPGATNVITGIATAFAESIPMICITGQVNSELRGSDVFQEADITGAVESFVKYSYLVKKVVFKVEILPMIKLISCLLVHAFFVLIMMIMYLVAGRMPMLSWIQVIYYSFAASMLALGLGYFTSSVNVFFKDMSQIVGICLQFGIWMAPIMYHESMFTNRLPWIEPLFKINPFYYIVTGYKDSMITGNWFWERPKLTIYYWVFTLLVFGVGLKMFKKLRPHFSDVL